MPYDKKPGAVTRMYNKKGKQVGLMVEGSMAYMDHGSAAHHAGKSELHKDPNKDMPDDGHLHKGGKKPTQPEGKQLTNITPARLDDPELEKAIAKRKRIEEIRLKQQEAHEARDRRRNELEQKKQELRKEKKEYKVQEPRIGKIN